MVVSEVGGKGTLEKFQEFSGGSLFSILADGTARKCSC